MKTNLSIFAIAAVLTIAVPAAAATKSTTSASSSTTTATSISSTFHVTATVTHTAGCFNIVTPDINFGTLTATVVNNVLTVPAAIASSTTTILCDVGLPIHNTISAGNAGTESSSPSGRFMLNGTTKLFYTIMLTNPSASGACSNFIGVFGDGTNGTLTANGTSVVPPTAATQPSGTVCAVLPAQAWPGDGTFIDTLVYTQNF